MLQLMQLVHRQLSQDQFREVSCHNMESVYMLGSIQHVQHQVTLSVACVAHIQIIDDCANFIVLSQRLYDAHVHYWKLRS